MGAEPAHPIGEEGYGAGFRRAGAGRLAFHAVSLAALLLAGCGSLPLRQEEAPPPPRSEKASAGEVASAPAHAKKGGYYLDDGPGDHPPPNLEAVPDAVPKPEPLRPANARPYEAMGKLYTPMDTLVPYKEVGLASWYGRRFQGKKTASGEPYDMYAMTAAHPVLPIPSYARVTNLKNGKSVIVRINDRGPFHSDRIIDLSYTAAYKLGVLQGGSALVEVESIIPGAEPPTQLASIAGGPEEKPAASPAQQDPPAKGGAAPARTAEKAAPDPDPVREAALAPSSLPGGEGAAQGYYLQLGAFSSQGKAESFLARLRSRLAFLGDSLQVFAQGGLFRVHAGPYVSASAARRIADRIANSLEIKPLMVVR